MSNKIYDILKWVAILGLPALATLYDALASTWGLPYGEEVIRTVNAITTCLGTLLGISTIKYNKKVKGD